ncbi:glutathionylspermidine synthase family protein [Rhodoplanes sp. TEM]|uniref:Glutathionylspermidine synthase family protein n=1 Tax=Rhodoplanes tepidamans TaxID=200616 RepID=A0ABT5JKF0_RHOTP|nr:MULTISPECIES: glutathionylspermidine synthase family protein [Rhodoplanes]MDC7789831.1 glutathionylspermidine synthase family protein [Rhodoplanes tepidamans]MDC7987580.1 glutathionylspermidine synthase family protein [Rhodoplanes sp. TEM]MDQ0359221.1 glutathionylspermidine synthase [Rhodoplanes tepidamans]
MRRIACPERDDWKATAERVGFDFHTIGGAPYWDETAYYGFTLEQIERDIEAPTLEIDRLCRELVARAVDDERILRLLQIPEAYWTYIAASWKRGDPSLYGRLDLCYDGQGPAKLLEYNADTPTALYETGVFQWLWLEEAIARKIVPAGSDQFNSVHEKLIAGWREVAAAISRGAATGQGHGEPVRGVHLAGALESTEDLGTLAYLEDTARQAGLDTTMIAMDRIGRRPNGDFVDEQDRPIALAFKLYPWEWMFREAFGRSLPGASTRWIEPPWKAILSSKGILPLLWSMFPRHPNLLPAWFEDDPESAQLGESYARKPLYSREGANVALVVGGEVMDSDSGPYGAEGFVRQAVATLPRFDGGYPVLGSWIVNGEACGLSVREDASPITKNTSRFLPHAILP